MKKADWDDIMNIDGTIRNDVTVTLTGKQFNKLVKDHIRNSKIEVFDEMDNTFRDLKSRYPTITEQQILSAFRRIKKRHLSILQK
jgi:hypothetical protein